MIVEYILNTKKLSKKFGKEYVVDGVELKIPKGEIYGFLGPNGAGKTTTIRLILGLMKPTDGEIFLFNKNLKNDKIDILHKVGSLVENPSYYPHLTAFENLEAIRKILNVEPSRIEEVLKIVRLSEVGNKKVKNFSLGMKQRLGIAAALLHNPELLILDEPTNGLDPSGIIEIRELIKSLPSKYGMTVLISSHLLSEIEQMATTVGILNKGKLIFQDSIEKMQLYAKRKITLKVSNVEKASKLLLAKGIKIVYKDGYIELINCSDENIAHTVATLVYDGYSIFRVEEEKSSLEEIFLKITKGENRI